MTEASISPWYVAAQAEIGVAETAGPEHTARVLEYFRLAGHPEIPDDETAWCAAFACAMLESSGVRSPKSLRARAFLDWGVAVTQARPGDIVVFRRGTNPAQGHVGFFVRWSDDNSKILVLGGNQSNAVRYQWYAATDLLGVRRPIEAAGAPSPQMSHEAPRAVKSSRKWSLSEAWSRVLGALGLGTAGTVTAEQSELLPDAIRLVKQFAVDHAGLLIVGGIVAGVLVSETIKQLVKEDVADGRYKPSGDQ